MSLRDSSRPGSGEPLVVAERLRRSFRTGGRGEPLSALAEISFAVWPHEIVGVVGENGAGKTTLVDVLATVLAPDGGTARIAGFDIREHAREARALTGYVPSGARALYPRLTVRQNLKFFAALQGLVGRQADVRIAELLRLCGASGVESVRADRVSDGMVARVALARAMLHDPRVLLLDEPERSVDPVHRPVLLGAIRRFADRGGRGAIVVSHGVDDLLGLSDRVLVLRGGRIVSELDAAGGGVSSRHLLSAAISGGAQV